jgi:hypothetical protein
VFSWKIKLLVVSLKGLVAQTNLLAVNRQLYSNSDSYGYTRAKLRCMKDQPLLSRRRVHSEHINGLGTNKHLVMVPDGARNQKRLCWRGPGVIHCTGLNWSEK